FTDQFIAAVDQAGLFGPKFLSPARNVIVIRFVGLTQIRRIAVGNRLLLFHPADGGAGVEAAREGNADLFTDWYRLQNLGHQISLRGARCSVDYGDNHCNGLVTGKLELLAIRYAMCLPHALPPPALAYAIIGVG